ncbi:MAG: MMPL family transporter [Planctomycetota bacterium]
MASIATSITRYLIRFRYALLVVAGILAICAFYPAAGLELDRTIDSMFSPDSELLAPYKDLKRIFGGNDVVLCVYDDPDFLNEDESGMKRLKSIGRRLKSVPGVGGILTLEKPLGSRIVDTKAQVSIDMREVFQGYTHGADGRTACVACMLLPEESSVPREETVRLLRAAMQDLPDGLAPGTVAGEPVMMVDAFRFIDRDGKRLVTITTLLLAAVILICFRSVRWVLIPIAVVQLALLLTNGVLAASGTQLTMVSSMLTAVVTVIGVATVVHVILRFREGRETGLNPVEALQRAGKMLTGPIFWACITDAVGFAALMAADVAPVRDFGLMMALGAVMVFVSAGLLIPGLALVGEGDNKPQRLWGESVIERQLQRLVNASQDRSLLVGLSLVVLIVIAVTGISKLEIETDFTRNFRDDTTIVQSYELVESKLGGAGVCDIVIPAPKRLNWSYLRKVMKIQDMLREEVVIPNDNPEIAGDTQPGLTKVLSLADAVVGSAPVNLSRVPSKIRERFLSTQLSLMHSKIPAFYDALYHNDSANEEKFYYRIMLRALERQPAEQKVAIINQVQAVCDREMPKLNPQVTGYFVLITNLINGILRDQWRTFAVALAGIALTMFVALRSFRLAMIALVPNAIPILVVNGLMGWLGLKINMGAAMIAAVSVGLSIDSSIHYLYAYKRARNRGCNQREGLAEVQNSVGRALVLATGALIVGFSVLAISEFIPTVYFGVLVSLSMLGGLVGNLLWLPMLISLTESQATAAAADLSPAMEE